MKGLIQKSGYIKPGNGGGHYAEYIATREGVELMDAQYPSHECSGYLEYMAERPRSHGLFSADGAADLEQTMEEINAHAGPVWTFIYSLKREDAARLGYENGESWRRLLLAHQTELATAMKIPPSNFRWCAAFHDEKHHPHIHMMAWCADPKQGYLTEKGIEQMRSQLSNDIFQDELLSIYQEKDLSYQEVRDAAMEAMGRLIREMKSGLCVSPIIAGQMETLAGMLTEVKGKKVYGYRSSLELALSNHCETVAFPLISSGVYGYPKDQALKVAVDTIGDFLLAHDMTVYLVIFDRAAYTIGGKLFADIAAYIDDRYVDAHTDSRETQRRRMAMASMPMEESECMPAPCATAPSGLDEALSKLDESFSQMLLRKIDEQGMTDAQCYKKANIDRKLFSKIRSDVHYKPSKPTAMAFAVALELPLEEAREMLGKAGFAFSHASKFDIIVEYFIAHRNYNIFEINEALFAFDQSLLGG